MWNVVFPGCDKNDDSCIFPHNFQVSERPIYLKVATNIAC